MNVAALSGLHAFADLYVRGWLAEDFAEQYGVKRNVPPSLPELCPGQ